MRRIRRINTDKNKERSVKIRLIRLIRAPFDSVFMSPRLNVALPQTGLTGFFKIDLYLYNSQNAIALLSREEDKNEEEQIFSRGQNSVWPTGSDYGHDFIYHGRLRRSSGDGAGAESKASTRRKTHAGEQKQTL
jgi:hypothetical protein